MPFFPRSRDKNKSGKSKSGESSISRFFRLSGVHDEAKQPVQNPEPNTAIIKVEHNVPEQPDPKDDVTHETPGDINQPTTSTGAQSTLPDTVDLDNLNTEKSYEGTLAKLQGPPNQKVPQEAYADIWSRTYDSLKNKDPNLVGDYEMLLSTKYDFSRLDEARDMNLIIQDDVVERRAQMEEIMKARQKRLEQRKYKYSFLGRERVLEDDIASAVNVVLWGKDWIGEAIRFSPEASLVWAGNSEGFEYVTLRMHWYVEFDRLLLQAFEDHRTEPLRPQFEQLVEDLYQKVLEFQIRSILRFFRARTQRLGRDALRLDSWKEMANAVEQCEAVVKKSAQQIRETLGLEVTRDIHDDTTDMRRMMREQADVNITESHAKCLQVFRLVDASSSAHKSHKEAGYEEYKRRIGERVEGTCEWFLEQENFMHWLAGDSEILLVTADPGCGKSVLAKFLIDNELPRRMFEDQEPFTICYFFFMAQIQSDITHALCAILHQLLYQRPSLIQHAMPEWRANGEKLRYIPDKLWQILQNAILDNEAGRVVLVVDALDECEEEDRRRLVSYLQKHFQLDPASRGKLKVLCTGRPYSNVTSCFYELEQSHPGLKIPGEDETDKITMEINAVITYRVRKLERIRNLEKASLKYMEDSLLLAEHRTYLWLCLLFHHLEDPRWKLTEKSFNEILTDVPPDFDKAYENILKMSRDREGAMKVFKILLAADRPLTIREVQLAFELSSAPRSMFDLDLDDVKQFKKRLRDFCGLLVTINNQRVYFLHQTAREFLILKTTGDQSSSNKQEFAHSISIEEAHLALAQCCIVYICLRDENHI